jgi:hypothetical protein
MRKPGCRHCMCPELEPCEFHGGELFLLVLLIRPARCCHCTERQFVWVSPVRWLGRALFGGRSAVPRYRR